MILIERNKSIFFHGWHQKEKSIPVVTEVITILQKTKRHSNLVEMQAELQKGIQQEWEVGNFVVY